METMYIDYSRNRHKVLKYESIYLDKTSFCSRRLPQFSGHKSQHLGGHRDANCIQKLAKLIVAGCKIFETS